MKMLWVIVILTNQLECVESKVRRYPPLNVDAMIPRFFKPDTTGSLVSTTRVKTLEDRLEQTIKDQELINKQSQQNAATLVKLSKLNSLEGSSQSTKETMRLMTQAVTKIKTNLKKLEERIMKSLTPLKSDLKKQKLEINDLKKRVTVLESFTNTQKKAGDVFLKLNSLERKVNSAVTEIREKNQDKPSSESILKDLEQKVKSAVATLSKIDGRIKASEATLTRLREAPQCPLNFMWDKASSLCAKIHNKPVRRDDADCSIYGESARVAILDTANKMKAIKEHLQQINYKLTPFVGGKKSDFYMDYYWGNGNTVTKGWCSGEPRRDASCISVNSIRGYCLDDVDCSGRSTYLCEIQMTGV